MYAAHSTCIGHLTATQHCNNLRMKGLSDTTTLIWNLKWGCLAKNEIVFSISMHNLALMSYGTYLVLRFLRLSV